MTDQPAGQHRNDIYGDLEAESSSEAIPAATVVLVRDASAGDERDASIEVLMLRKSSKIAFGGMWVFPGGRIDEDDRDDAGPESAARNAAVREAHEEAGVVVSPDSLVWFAHWSPPPSTRRRFATWFFAGAAEAAESDEAGADPVTVDGGEILEHEWIAPGAALERHAAGEIDLAPPTWVTLYHLSRYQPAATLLGHLDGIDARVYETHVAERSDGVRVAMWRGDAGYDDWNADASGARHRLVMAKGGFTFEHAESDY